MIDLIENNSTHFRSVTLDLDLYLCLFFLLFAPNNFYGKLQRTRSLTLENCYREREAPFKVQKSF